VCTVRGMQPVTTETERVFPALFSMVATLVQRLVHATEGQEESRHRAESLAEYLRRNGLLLGRRCSSSQRLQALDASWDEKQVSLEELLARVLVTAVKIRVIATEMPLLKAASQALLVDRCVERAVRLRKESGYREKHVLAQGCKLERDGRVLRRCGNDAVRLLKLPCWEALRRLIGDEAMEHLLLETVMLFRFRKAKVQLTGPLLYTQIHRAGTDLLATRTDSRTKQRVVLKRDGMFYASRFTRKCNLPSKHVLNDAKMTGRRLAKIIFKGQKRMGRSQAKQQREWATRFLQNHRRCPYGVILNKICPIDADEKNGRAITSMNSCLEPKQISKFLKDIFLRLCGRSKPKQCRKLLEDIGRVAFLRKKEEMDLNLVAERSELPLFLVDWIFNDFLVPLIRSVFYLTERSDDQKLVVFYRKPVWSYLCKRELREMKQRGMLFEFKKNNLDAFDKSKLRFVPKASGGLRPIINCKSRNYKLAFVSYALAAAFRDASQIRKRPQILGLSEFYEAYKGFVVEARRVAERKPLHVLVLDVSKCFDRMEQDQVCEAVRSALQQDMYTISAHHRIFTNRAAQRIRGVVTRFTTSSTVFNEAATLSKECILVDRAEISKISRDEILRKVEEHVKQNLISFEDMVFLQRKGVPQGSILSSLLCTLHFERFEQAKEEPILFPQTNNGNVFCLRLLDDYLVISSDLPKLERFEAAMSQGFPEFGVFVEPSKTKRSRDSADQSVPWCGFRINASDLSVTFDLERLNKSISKKRRPSDDSNGHANLREAMQTLSVRANPALFDKAINICKETAMSNLHILMELVLAKLSWKDLEDKEIIQTLSRVTSKLIVSRTKGETLIRLPDVQYAIESYKIHTGKD